MINGLDEYNSSSGRKNPSLELMLTEITRRPSELRRANDNGLDRVSPPRRYKTVTDPFRKAELMVLVLLNVLCVFVHLFNG